MLTLFDGPVWVHYGFMFLTPAGGEAYVDLDASRVGQQNGLLGGALGDRLSMITGTHTGTVSVRVEWHDGPPVSDDPWEEIVEVSFNAAIGMSLSAFEEFHDFQLPRGGSTRARYCALGMDTAREIPDESEPCPDRYLLQIWPAAASPERIVRQTSETAAYWHGVARDTPIAAIPQLDSPDISAGMAVWQVPTGVTGVEILNLLPLSVKVLVPEWLAHRAAVAAGIVDRPIVCEGLAALRHRHPLPDGLSLRGDLLDGEPLPPSTTVDQTQRVLATFRLAAVADPYAGDLGGVYRAAQLAANGDPGPDLLIELCHEFGFDGLPEGV